MRHKRQTKKCRSRELLDCLFSVEKFRFFLCRRFGVADRFRERLIIMRQNGSIYSKLCPHRSRNSALAVFLAVIAFVVTTTGALSAPPSKTGKRSKSSKTEKKAPAPAKSAASAQNRSDFLLRLDQAFATNALRAEDSYVNKRVTFLTYAGNTQRKDGRPLLSTTIQYTNPSVYVAANVSLVPSMTKLAASLEQGDRIEVSAVLRRRDVRTQSSVQYGGSLYNGSGIVGGGTVTQNWSEYTFVEGTFRVLSRAADERQAEAARLAKLRQESEKEELRRNEVYQRALQDFDVSSIREVLEWGRERNGATVWYEMTNACIAADPNSANYAKVREAYRFLNSNEREGEIPEKILKMRRAELLQDLLDSEFINNYKVNEKLLDRFENVLGSEREKPYSEPIELKARDIEVFRVLAKHYQDYWGDVWVDSRWKKNQFLDTLRELFPKKSR